LLLVVLMVSMVAQPVLAKKTPSRNGRYPTVFQPQSGNPLADLLLEVFSPDYPTRGVYDGQYDPYVLEGRAAGIAAWYLDGQFGRPFMMPVTGPYMPYSNQGGQWNKGFWDGYLTRSPYDEVIRQGVNAGFGATYTPYYWPYAYGTPEWRWYKWAFDLGSTRQLSRFEWAKPGDSSNPPPLDNLPPAPGDIIEESSEFAYPEE
jgi:hypothetical protein